MSHVLSKQHHSCDEHSDCTTTIWHVDGVEIGRRHTHQWVDVVGKGGRPSHEVWIGTLDVGILLGFDPTSGDYVFDPTAVVLSGSRDFEDIEVSERIGGDHLPWANDHRDDSKVVSSDLVLTKPPSAREEIGPLEGIVDSVFGALSGEG
jgi:hypothetical protein